MTYANAVFPVPGWPPISTALPAILPSLIIFKITPAALLALAYREWLGLANERDTYLTHHTL